MEDVWESNLPVKKRININYDDPKEIATIIPPQGG